MSDNCGCCEGLEPLTPLATANRPGLSVLAYRAGTHATFLTTMKARLSAGEFPPLAALTTRAATDPAIAMLDAWATVADVLTFYQERIANEGYLRTAAERRSILELARLVGYEPRPGVAASAYLAFTLEDGYKLEIPVGTRAQSLPGPGELPQFFETAEKLEARAEWNTLAPRRSRPQSLQPPEPLQDNGQTTHIYIKGVTPNLGRNDRLLIDFDDQPQPAFFQVRTVEPDAAADRTLVTLMPVPITSQLAPGVSREFGDEIREVAERYLRIDEHHVSLRAATTRRVVSILQQLQASGADPTRPPEDVVALVGEILPQLDADRRFAAERGYGNLEPWLSAMVQELEDMIAEWRPAGEAPVAARVAGASAEATDPEPPSENGVSPLEKLEELLEPLAIAPSKQPANALELPQSLKQSFVPQGLDQSFASTPDGTVPDALTRLVKTMQPEVGDNLYPAWEQTGTKRSATQVYALTTARLFGHNAPLKPVIEEKDGTTTVRYDEWTFDDVPNDGVNGSFQIRVAVDRREFSDPSNLPRTVITVTVGDEPHTVTLEHLQDHDFDHDFPTTQQKIEGNVSVQDVAGGGKRFTVTLDFVDRQMSVNMSDQLFPTISIPSPADSANVNDGEQEGEGLVTAETTPPSAAQIGVEVTYPGAGKTITINGQTQRRSRAKTERENVISLDAPYKQILRDSWVVVEKPSAADTSTQTIIARAQGVREVSRADYGIAAGSTELTLSDNQGDSLDWLDLDQDTFAVIRGTLVHAQSEPLELADAPLVSSNGRKEVQELDDNGDAVTLEPVCGERIELDALYDGLEPGRWLIVSGERDDLPGVTASELVMLAAVEQGFDSNLPGDKVRTTLVLANELAYRYRRETVTIYGNVGLATHGETRTEVLGSGDGSKALQKFGLKQSPLTHVAATTPTGIESTLEVRVDDIRWREASNLADLIPTDRCFITQRNERDEVTVVFGDGEHGARLPTGVENVRAVYRTGIGKAGNVAAEQISQLATRPLGLKGVTNPQPATGGAERDSADQARRNVPVAVMALDRLVSVRDYEDFARAFAGLAKARALRFSDGRRQLVHLTIAGIDDIPISEDSELYRNLVQALHRFGDPQQPLSLEVRELIMLIISARVRVLADYQWEWVEPKVRAALLDTFGFERRELGQDALLSEVISTIQSVPGVAYVDVDTFGGIPEKKEDPEKKEEASASDAEAAADTSTLDQRRALLPSEIADAIKELVERTDQPVQRVAVELAGRDDGSIRPGQLAFLTPRVPETLILKEITS
jgi:predicted phage baseplate assembly protein